MTGVRIGVVSGDGANPPLLTPSFTILPLYALPKIDLSVSIQSRWLRSPLFSRILAFLERPSMSKPIFLAYLLSWVCLPTVMMVSQETGKILAVASVILATPMIVVAASALRYEFLLVLLKTYDVCLFTLISTTTFFMIGVMLRDLRSILVLPLWVSFQHNVFVDANIRNHRRIWIATTLETIGFTIVGLYASLGLVDGMHDFVLMQYNGHRFPATAFVHDGMLSILVVLYRNLVRRYQSMRQEPTSSVMKCIGFRCRLQLVDTTQAGSVRVQSRITSRSNSAVGPLTQTRFVPFLGEIEPTKTLWRFDSNYIEHQLSKANSRTTRAFHACLNLAGVLGFVVPYTVIGLGFVRPSAVGQTGAYVAWGLSSICAVVFFASSISCFHRDLFRSIVTSFDFALITGQSTFVHLFLADVYGWHGANTASLIVSWCWAVWVVSWDAVTPPFRRLLGIHPRFPAFIGIMLVSTTTAVAITLIFILPPSRVRDRVLLRGRMFGVDFELHALSMFFSMLGTISAWSLRVIWRLCFAQEHELVVLDGLVVYRTGARIAPTNAAIVPAAGRSSPQHATLPVGSQPLSQEAVNSRCG